MKKKDKMERRRSRTTKVKEMCGEKKREEEKGERECSVRREEGKQKGNQAEERKKGKERRKGKRINRQRLDRVVLGLQTSAAEGTAEDGSCAPRTTLGD